MPFSQLTSPAGGPVRPKPWWFHLAGLMMTVSSSATVVIIVLLTYGLLVQGRFYRENRRDIGLIHAEVKHLESVVEGNTRALDEAADWGTVPPRPEMGAETKPAGSRPE